MPRLPLWAGLLAVLLTLPALNGGLLLDDHGILLAVRGDSEILEHMNLSPLDLFRFMDGDQKSTRELVNMGVLPWWSNPEMKAAFWRPVTSLTHFVEFKLWGEHVWLMHLSSVLLYGVLVGLASVLYRRWLGLTGAAVLAAVFFAVDHTNATPVVWLANRNALLAVLFGLVTLWSHDRWRRDSWKPGPFLAITAYVLSLLSGEAGIAVCAYLFAYAIFMDRGTVVKAMLCIVPYAVVTVLWRIAWAMQNYGTSSIGLYTDPLREPVMFLSALAERFPLYFLSQWALPPSDLYSTTAGPEAQQIHLIAAVVFMVLTAIVFRPILRRNKTACFFLTGMLLSLVPICAAFVSDRMLLFAGLGAIGLISEIIKGALGDSSRLWPLRAMRIPAVTLAVLLMIVHAAVSPVLLVTRIALTSGYAKIVDYVGLVSYPLGDDIHDKDIIIVNAIEPSVFGSGLQTREARGMKLPRSFRALSPSGEGVELKRMDDRTLLLRVAGNFYSGNMNKLFFGANPPMQAGHRVELRGTTVEVTRVDEKGAPIEARFTFDVPLENPRLRWIHWSEDEECYYTSAPPQVGETVDL